MTGAIALGVLVGAPPALAVPLGAAAVDGTPPVIAPWITGMLGTNGWYVSDATLGWDVSDPESGITETSPDCRVQTFTADTRGVDVTCSATNGVGLSGSYTATVRLDQTAPSVTANPGRAADSNGWYNRALSIAFVGTDATSGISACSSVTYSGPDTASASVSGACSDRAGNTAGTAFDFRYDATAPSVSAGLDRAPDANGWYNSPIRLSVSGSDATSGIASCDSPTYSGPDSASASVAGGCRDVAGNTASRSAGLRYDATSPSISRVNASRPPDRNGWYNDAVTFSFAGTDATSGIASCDALTYSGPDTASVSLAGGCRDNAGNASGPAATLVKYDATAPSVSANPDRAPNENGWYNRAVTFSFGGADATSGVESCAAPLTYAGPDHANASVAGSCRDVAGNTTSRTFPVSYDETRPSLAGATAAREPDANGWYNHPVVFRFSGADATSGIEACDAPTYGGPDSAAASVNGVCRDRAGNESGVGSAALRYDDTDPTVTGIAPERAPDANGWYNRPVAFSVSGTDALSGIDACGPGRYDGPDRKGAAATGTCRDRAGNESSAAFPLDYDATPPKVDAAPNRKPDAYGWYGRDVRFAFRGSDATSGVASCSAPVVYAGPRSERASVAGTCRDVAGNSATGTATFRYAEPLLLPRAGVRVSSPPRLRWVSVAGARHYNVQLWRSGRKLLSAWPRATHFQLSRTWTFAGRSYGLEPGRYTWYVWPRVGRRYGRVIGRSSFVVRGR